MKPQMPSRLTTSQVQGGRGLRAVEVLGFDTHGFLKLRVLRLK